MIDQRLYIDNVLVDIDDSTKITLDIKSNLLRDVSKIVSNATYTVKLPKTVHNQTVFGHSDKINAGGEWAYTMHSARYFVNGVEIIGNGKAVLLSIGSSIEISIIWGLYDKFSSLVSKGTTLNELTNSDRILYSSSNTPETYANALNKDYFYAILDVWKHEATIDYTWKHTSSKTYPEGGRGGSTTAGSTGGFGGNRGDGSSTNKGVEYLPPCVKASYLLRLIKEQLGVDFVWTGDAIAYINTLIIPLISRKSNELTFDGQFTASIPQTAITGTNFLLNVRVDNGTNVFNEVEGSTHDKLTVASDANVIFDITADWAWDNTSVSPQGHGSSNGSSYDNYGHQDNYIRMIITSGSEETEYVVGINGSVIDRVPSGYKGLIKKTMTGYGKIELKKGDTIQFRLTNARGMLVGTQFYGATIKATLSSDENVPSGGYYPICYNLPKIKVIDYIKFLACVTGTFPMQVSADGIVKFVPFHAVWDNLSEAVDYSSRLIPSESSNKPKDIEYTVSEWCQHNWYKWKEDDTVVGNYNGEIHINNNSLNNERDVFTFPFAATDGRNVPMFSKETSTGDGSFGSGERPSEGENEDNEPSYSACKDRILRLAKDDNGNATGNFDINMQAILDEKYSLLTQTLNNAHVIKENIIISNIELLSFDETKPVYLAQYGAYFAVTEIKASSNGTAEVTMLQLYIE